MIAAGAWLGMLLAQDGNPVRLGWDLPAGQIAQVELDSSVDIEISSASSAEEAKPSKTSLSVREKFSQQVAALGRVKISCSSSTTSRNGKETPAPYVGKSFYVQGDPGSARQVLTESGARCAEPYAPHLGRWMDLALLLPPDPVAVDQTWTADLRGVVLAVAPNFPLSELKAHCTLKAIQDREARISFTWEGRDKVGGKTLEAKLEGTLVVDIALRRVLKFDLAGGFKTVEEILEKRENLDDRTSETTRIGSVQVVGSGLRASITFQYSS